MSQLWKPRGEFINASGWDQQVPEKIRELASRRGLIEWDHFQSWTQPRLSNLRDPQKLLGMDEAINRLVLAHENQEKVALYGDFDLDGTSALALLESAFSKIGFSNIVLYQPSRLNEGYGFHIHAVESLHAAGVTLIVTADVGITAVAAAQKCRELGVDLIITDHHLPAAEKPSALALINPNQGGCPSELGHLSGVGVAFYLTWALRRKLVQLGRVTEQALELKELLDCFVIGTLTDMVPIREENRVLVKHGLLQLAKTKRPGIRFLLEELDLVGRDLSSQDVAIRFAPKLNALSRMEKNIRPLDLFMVQSEIEARDLMGQVLAQNDMRVTLQAEAEQLALGRAKDWDDKPFVFIFDQSFHKGVIGLVATRLSQVCQKPAFVGSVSDEGIVVASARAPQSWGGNLVKVLESAALYLHRFGGHSNAAGFEYSLSQVDDIVKCFEAFLINESVESERDPVLYDIELGLQEITPAFMNWIDLLGPFGQTFEVPLFKVRGVEVLSMKELRGGHRRLELNCGGIMREALLFGPSEQQLMTLGAHRIIDVLAEIQWNYFQNRKRLQLLIRDMRPCEMAEGKGHESEAKDN
jgi:single-stranded-DNA-specific exonuclease